MSLSQYQLHAIKTEVHHLLTVILGGSGDSANESSTPNQAEDLFSDAELQAVPNYTQSQYEKTTRRLEELVSVLSSFLHRPPNHAVDSLLSILLNSCVDEYINAEITLICLESLNKLLTFYKLIIQHNIYDIIKALLDTKWLNLKKDNPKLNSLNDIVFLKISDLLCEVFHSFGDDIHLKENNYLIIKTLFKNLQIATPIHNHPNSLLIEKTQNNLKKITSEIFIKTKNKELISLCLEFTALIIAPSVYVIPYNSAIDDEKLDLQQEDSVVKREGDCHQQYYELFSNMRDRLVNNANIIQCTDVFGLSLLIIELDGLYSCNNEEHDNEYHDKLNSAEPVISGAICKSVLYLIQRIEYVWLSTKKDTSSKERPQLFPISNVYVVLHFVCQVVFNLLTHYQTQLKVQMEVFLSQLLLKYGFQKATSHCVPIEASITICESLFEYCAEPNLLQVLFVTYDCDIYYRNICHDLIKAIFNELNTTDNKTTPSKYYVDYQSILGECVFHIIHSLSIKCNLSRKHSSLMDSKQSNNLILSFDKKKKFYESAQVFNSFAEKVKFSIITESLLRDNMLPEGNLLVNFTEFLLENPFLDLAIVGELISKPDDINQELLYEFLSRVNFSQLNPLDALRKLLSKFKLPGEAQCIERIVESFGKVYFEQNPSWFGEEENRTFKSQDTMFILSYSIIMLNTDLHSPFVKNRMKLDAFISNNRGIDGGADLPRDFLVSIYESIEMNEIKMVKDINSTSLVDLDDVWDGLIQRRKNELNTSSNIISFENFELSDIDVTIFEEIILKYIDLPLVGLNQKWPHLYFKTVYDLVKISTYLKRNCQHILSQFLKFIYVEYNILDPKFIAKEIQNKQSDVVGLLESFEVLVSLLEFSKEEGGISYSLFEMKDQIYFFCRLYDLGLLCLIDFDDFLKPDGSSINGDVVERLFPQNNLKQVICENLSQQSSKMPIINIMISSIKTKTFSFGDILMFSSDDRSIELISTLSALVFEDNDGVVELRYKIILLELLVSALVRNKETCIKDASVKVFNYLLTSLKSPVIGNNSNSLLDLWVERLLVNSLKLLLRLEELNSHEGIVYELVEIINNFDQNDFMKHRHRLSSFLMSWCIISGDYEISREVLSFLFSIVNRIYYCVGGLGCFDLMIKIGGLISNLYKSFNQDVWDLYVKYYLPIFSSLFLIEKEGEVIVDNFNEIFNKFPQESNVNINLSIIFDALFYMIFEAVELRQLILPSGNTTSISKIDLNLRLFGQICHICKQQVFNDVTRWNSASNRFNYWLKSKDLTGLIINFEIIRLLLQEFISPQSLSIIKHLSQKGEDETTTTSIILVETVKDISNIFVILDEYVKNVASINENDKVFLDSDDYMLCRENFKKMLMLSSMEISDLKDFSTEILSKC